MTDDAETLACLALADFYDEQPTMDKITTFSEYSKHAASTQLDSCKNAEYLCYGLMSEVGELCGLFQKARRGDFNLTDKLDDFRKEIGDCFWNVDRYVNFTFDGSDISYVTAFDNLDLFQLRFGVCDVDPSKPMNDLIDAASKLHTWALEYNGSASPRDLHSLTLSIVRSLVRLSSSLDLSISDILTTNAQKLADRKARGVIQGNGDNR